MHPAIVVEAQGATHANDTPIFACRGFRHGAEFGICGQSRTCPRAARHRHPRSRAAPPPAAPSAKKITIYTAKTIVTLDPGTPTAEAVAVMDGKILGVGTLDEVKGWVTDEEVEIDQRFKDAVIVPGLIEAHMHPQITGVLWQGVYVGRFDRTAPDGTLGQGTGDQTGRPRPAQGCGGQTAGRRKLAGRLGLSAGVLRQLTAHPRRSRSDLQRPSDASSRICRCTSTTPTARRSRSPASATTPISSASSRRTASRPARSRRSRRLLLSPRSSRRSMPRRCSRRRGTPPSSRIVSA